IIALCEQLPTLQPLHDAENKWRAARYGLDAEIIISRDTDEAMVQDELRRLVDRLTPLAAELGCLRELDLVLEIIERGGGYERQRRAYQRTGTWIAAVDLACDELNELRPLEAE